MISATQASAYRRCPQAWSYRYVDGLKISPSWAVKGRGQHKAVEVNLSQKIETREDLPEDVVLDVARDTITEGLKAEDVVLAESETPGAIVDLGVAGVRVYHAERAPLVQPVMVEERVSVQLPWGSTLLGVLDCVDEGMRVRDAKFPTDMLKLEDALYEAQPPLYAYAYRELTGDWPAGVIFDVVASGRAKVPQPKAAELELTVTPETVTVALADLQRVEQAIQAGIVYKRADKMVCRGCGYHALCWGTGGKLAKPAPVAVAPEPEPVPEPVTVDLFGTPEPPVITDSSDLPGLDPRIELIAQIDDVTREWKREPTQAEWDRLCTAIVGTPDLRAVDPAALTDFLALLRAVATDAKARATVAKALKGPA